MADDSQFRDHSANERTLLAWIRTGVALMAFGFGIARFGLFLREMAPAAAPPSTGELSPGSVRFGIVLVLFGFVCDVAATARYLRMRAALLEHRTAVPGARLVCGVGIGLALVALAMALMLGRTLAR